MQKTTLLTIFALSCLSAAAGPVYSCGNGSYSSKPGPGCQRADLPTMILEQELANERRALATAQRALTESRTMPKGDGAAYQAHQARVSSLQSDVLDRQQNIQALQRELSRM